MNTIKITYKLARRIAVTLVGTTVLLIGVIMLVTPGPAVVFIPIGLAILGLEFAWARTWLKHLRERISTNNSRLRAKRAENHRQRHVSN
jgi:tellurite resistance protein TerC